MDEKQYHMINSPHLVSQVQAGVKFPDGQICILPDMLSRSDVNLPVNATLEVAIHYICQYLKKKSDLENVTGEWIKMRDEL